MIAGGQENMSMSPHILPGSRDGFRMGNAQLVDTMVYDGLTDAYNQYHMGITAENIAAKYEISRDEQDQLAVTSQNRAEAAQKAGKFADEITPVLIPQRKGDRLPSSTMNSSRTAPPWKAWALRAAFKKDGTVTAGNASGINDGAAAVLMMSAAKAAELGLTRWPAAGYALSGCARKSWAWARSAPRKKPWPRLAGRWKTWTWWKPTKPLPRKRWA